MKRFVLLALLAASQTAWATQLRSDTDIRRILTDRLKGFEQRVSIVVGAIGPEGRRVVAYGSMGLNDPRPVDGDTLYEIGSISKVFTSLILADMVERGEVALDDPVAKYLPSSIKVPERNGKRITLYDLSTHRSGLPRMPSNFDPKDPNNPYVDYPVERLYEFLSGYELTRDIGAEYEYSNLGAGLLLHALARRAGMDYERLLRERVFRPLGMTGTGVSLTSEVKSRLAMPHTSVFRLAPTPLWDFTEAFAGAGALRSSVNDLLTFLAANLGYTRTPLSAAMARMLAVRRDATDSFKIGLGWRLEPQKDGMEIVWHGGASYGSRTFAGFDPKSRSGVVVLSNYNSGSGIDDIGRHLLNANAQIDDGKVVKPSDRMVSSIPPGLLNAYAGRYRFDNNDIWTVRRDGTRFFIKRPAEPEFEVFPEGDFEKGSDDFFSKTADALFTFDFDKESPGVASQLTFRWAFLEPRIGRREGGSTQQSIQGVWQTVEYTITGPAARTITVREPRPNLTIFTARHYSRLEDQSEKPRSTLADPAKASADELRAVWGPFVGEAGTYELTGDNLLTMRPMVSKNPAVMGPGVFITYTLKRDGDTMWVTQQRNQNGPFANPFTVKLVRIE